MSVRAPRLSAGANIALLGIVGRKTGIVPKTNVLKDADDMDNVDDWFASSDEEEACERDIMEDQVEMVEVEVEEEQADMEESEVGEQELSFVLASPPPRSGGRLTIDQSILLNVTPIRRVSRADMPVFSEQDSMPWVSPPNLSPTRHSKSPASKRRESSAASVAAASRPSSMRSSSIVNARAKPTPRSPPPPPPADDEYGDDPENTSGYASTAVSKLAATTVTVDHSPVALKQKPKQSKGKKPSLKPRRDATEDVDDNEASGISSVSSIGGAAGERSSATSVSSVSSSGVDSVRLPPTPKVMIMDESQPRVRAKRRGKNVTEEEVEEDEEVILIKAGHSEDSNAESMAEYSEDDKKRRNKGKVAKKAESKPAKKPQKRKRDLDTEEEEEEAEEVKEMKEAGKQKRNKKGRQTEDEAKAGEEDEESDVQYARNAKKGRKEPLGAVPAASRASAKPTNATRKEDNAVPSKKRGRDAIAQESSRDEEDHAEEAKRLARRPKQGKGSKELTVVDEGQEEERTDEVEQHTPPPASKKGSKKPKVVAPTGSKRSSVESATVEQQRQKGRKAESEKSKQRAATPSPPPSPGLGVSFGGDVSGFSSEHHSFGIADVGSVSMEMASPDTTRGSYETYIPLKDAAPSSPVDQQHASSLDQSSMNLTVYEELPTFVDPNDCTWAANDSLVEETEANRQAPARRSKRKKVQPLAYWKNERVVYGFEEGEKMRSVKEIVRITSPEVAKKSSKKRRGTATTSTTTTKGKSKTTDGDNKKNEKKKRQR